MAGNFTRTFSRIEIFGHPTEGGIRSFKLQYRAADAGALTDITTPDLTTLESRAKGGTATISYNSGTHVFTMTGDYAGINLTADLVATDLRLIVVSSNTDWAQVLEVRVMRCVDWSDRVSALKATTVDADALRRKNKGTQASCTLRNTDGYLSPKRTDGPYNDQVGSGTCLMIWAGWKQVPNEWVPVGRFYTDQWQENRNKGQISWRGRDAVKLLSTDVAARYKVNQRIHDLIEYNANLAGFPSQWMNIDTVTGIIDYYAGAETSAYDEMQKLAEAAGFGALYVDRFGYLTFKALGTVAADTNSGTVVAGADYAGGPAVSLGGLMYYPVHGTAGWTLVAYNPATLTSSAVGAAFSTVSAVTPITAKIGADVYIVIIGTSRMYVYRWNASLTSPVLVRDSKPDIRFDGGVSASSPTLDGSTLHFTCWRVSTGDSDGVWSLDLLTLALTYHDQSALSVNGVNFTGIVWDRGSWYLAGVIGALWFRLYQWEPLSNTATLISTYATLSAFAGDSSTNGLATDGAGTFYAGTGFSYAGAPPAPTSPKRAIWKITAAGVATEYRTSDRISWSGLPGNVWDAVAYSNGLAFCGSLDDDASYKTRMLVYDSQHATSVDIGPLTLNASFIAWARSYTISGEPRVFIVGDRASLVDVRVREVIAASPTVQIDASPSVVGQDITLVHDDQRGGNSLLVNEGVAVSKPTQASAAATVWAADGLPWSVGVGTMSMKIRYSTKVVPGTAVTTLTFDSGGAGTATTTNETEEPVLTINVTTAGRITALSIDRQPLDVSSSLVAVVFGAAQSINRYGIRKETIENDYIYDRFTQSLIAGSIVQRFQYPKDSLDSYKAVTLLWHLDPFDLVTVTDTDVNDPARTGFNGTCYLLGAQMDSDNQTSTLRLIES